MNIVTSAAVELSSSPGLWSQRQILPEPGSCGSTTWMEGAVEEAGLVGREPLEDAG